MVVKIKIPGKLILAGEWAVLEPENSCIVLPVNKYLNVTINESEKIKLSNYAKNILVQNAIEITFKYLTENSFLIKNFSLTISSQISKIKIHNKFYKIGLGSSAATVVAIICGILKFHKIDIDSAKTKEIIFKLSAIAHYLGQNKIGSGVDIAASVYQKPLIYKKFDSDWLEHQLQNHKNITFVIKQNWPNLKITPISLPKNLIICACFSGQSASTKKLVPKILTPKNLEHFKSVTTEINKIVEKLICLLKHKRLNKTQQKDFLDLIKANRLLLKKLNPKLETPKLTKLIKIAEHENAAAKFSGAGGGDCGIAICFDKRIAQKIKICWKQAGLHPLR